MLAGEAVAINALSQVLKFSQESHISAQAFLQESFPAVKGEPGSSK